ncbi:MAG: hypothetical protein EB069_05970 [Actinobacteria bacterium]|nr:hypothetical protein [Actinomycetota bacterium]
MAQNSAENHGLSYRLGVFVRKNPKISVLIIFALVLLFASAYFDSVTRQQEIEDRQKQAENERIAKENAAQDILSRYKSISPESQQKLNRIRETFQLRAKESAGNAAREDALLSELKQTLCDLNPSIESWVAKLDSIRSNDGISVENVSTLHGDSGRLEIKSGYKAKLSHPPGYEVTLVDYMGNKYSATKVLIAKDNNEVVDKLLGLKKGDSVIFSGSLLTKGSVNGVITVDLYPVTCPNLPIRFSDLQADTLEFEIVVNSISKYAN